MSVRAAIVRRIQGDPFQNDGWGAALQAASGIYGFAVGLRDKCLRHGIVRLRRLPVPVISVGNLTVGGTGKTPLVALLARMLSETGLRVGILSRGYGRRGRLPAQPVALTQAVEEVGDEPFMLARLLPDADVWVGPDRHRVGLEAWRASRPQVFLLDDGFQHRSLHRDLDIVVLRAPRPLGNGRLLPAGPLREPPSALKRADLVVLNAADDPEEAAKAEGLIRAVVPEVPLVRAVNRPAGLFRAAETTAVPVEKLRGTRVASVCGIGNPDGFHRLLASLGARVERSLSFPDHHWYTSRDVEQIRQLAGEGYTLVTTDKDVWKLIGVGLEPETIWALRIQMEIREPDVLRKHLAGCVAGGGFGVR